MTSANIRWAAYAAILALTAGLLTAAVCRVKPMLSANDRSRWCTVWSLVERRTYQIDEIDAVPGWGTINKVRSQEHFYSSKPPFWSTCVAGVYWTVRAATGWRLNESLDKQTEETVRIILFIVNVVPMLVGIVVLIGMVERYGQTDFGRVFTVGAFALATFLTTFSVTLNNHTVAALAVLFSSAAACRIWVDGERRGASPRAPSTERSADVEAPTPATQRPCPGLLATAGFFAAFAAVNELPALAFAAGVFALMWWRSPAGTLKWFVPAALVPIAAFFVTNYLATGDWKPFYASYGTDKYQYTVDGVPSYWMHPAGLDANVESPLLYFLNCTIGHHGIFSLSPIFLLALAGWIVPRLSRQFPLRIWLWMAAGLTVIVLGFYLTRTKNYNYGGNSAGFRWMFWMIPLWILSMLPALDALAGTRVWKGIACALLVITTFSSWYPIENPWTHPWLFTLMERWGWIHYTQHPAPFTRQVTTFFPILPPDESAHDWIEFASVEPDGKQNRLRLADGGATETAGRHVRKITVAWKGEAGGERNATFLIDPAPFRAGEPPDKFLVWPAPPPDKKTQQAAAAFLQGLPAARPYRRGNVRYLKTPLRNDACECRLAAAQVESEDSQTEETAVHRIDVWLTSAVPFGVLQFEQTVSDADSREVLAVRRYTAVAASHVASGNPPEPKSE